MDLLDRIAPDTAVPVPAGMVAVAHDQFFAFLRKDPRDIMPRLTDPFYSSWQSPDQREHGRTYPGWKNSCDPKAYFLTHAAHAAIS